MGINTQAVHLRDTTIDDLRALGLAATGQTITGDDALSGGQVSALQLGPDVLLLDSYQVVAQDIHTSGLAVSSRVVEVLFASTSDVYSLAVGERAADGSPTTIRHLVRSVDDIPVDEGDPIPQEAEMTRLDEDTCLRLFHSLTGVELLSDKILWATFQVLDELPRDEPAKKGFWGRLFGS
ncbi:hypothetical protein [Ornithinimicrobium sp. Y1694]|uniref:hypothetical protein n=1 Tax=Ornithinimicrobium sp. Y1694 TaxID=3418590 RepID=UPI003CF49384